MTRSTDVLVTALAPVIWGSTYYVTTEFLPQGYPITMAALRALPAGLLLLAIVRRLPDRAWVGRAFVLGALNFAVFWTLLFVAAYRLPGGVAATLGATQALMVIVLARGLLGMPISLPAVMAAAAGVSGVALLVLGPDATLDPVGIAAGLGGSASMAAGTVLSRRWQPQVSVLTVTAWQLTAGGLILVPGALLLEPPLPTIEMQHLGGLAYLSLVGAASSYILWFRGLARLGPATVSMLGMMSPIIAVLIGWLFLGQDLSPVQMIAAAIILSSIWVGQQAAALSTTSITVRVASFGTSTNPRPREKLGTST